MQFIFHADNAASDQVAPMLRMTGVFLFNAYIRRYVFGLRFISFGGSELRDAVILWGKKYKHV